MCRCLRDSLAGCGSGNAGRLQALGAQPILVGRFGAAVVQALAALPWVVLIVGVGLCGVESELEESALLDHGPMRVLMRVTLRRAVGAIAGAALAVAVLTAGDMTVTDLLQVRTYAEEAFLQYTLGKGPGEAALVAVPPFLVLGVLILFVGRMLGRLDPARVVSSLDRARQWRLGAWRIPLGILLVGLVGNTVALPLYSLVWRAGRVGGRATMGRPPVWSAAGLLGTLQNAAAELGEPLSASLLWTALAATAAAMLAFGLGWAARRSKVWAGVAMVTLALTLATPGPIAGMALILAYQPYALIADTGAILVMAEVFRSLPYAILILWPFLCSFPGEYLEAAALDGLTPFAQMLRVVLPLSWRAILAAWSSCVRDRIGRASGHKPGDAAGRASGVLRDLEPATHRCGEPPGRSRAHHARCCRRGWPSGGGGITIASTSPWSIFISP